ncbi:hypothetical protein [Spongiimicrobium sp. 3-5]|uniref:hypothetical protein n=1 Tax=Spongiimicrobium sp. 3-5 TaxID=3332596 RepID=UPI003980FF7C
MNELKYYVGTGIKFFINLKGKSVWEKRSLTGITYINSEVTIWFDEVGYSSERFDFKPILKPLTELKQFLTGLEKVGADPTFFSTSQMAADLQSISNGGITDRNHYKTNVFLFLIKGQYDVFGLIEKGLAISSLDIEDEPSDSL